jgi:formylglycine-generating enzyme required for sulfatase activity
MVEVPAGSFLMGTPPTEARRDHDEGPVRMVRIAAFGLATVPVTRGEFAAFVLATGRSSSGGCWTSVPSRSPPWEEEPERSWRSPGFDQTERDPVVCVSWNDTQDYVAWLSQTTGHRYRLPTEAEWEYAARAGTTTIRFWGDGPEDACQFANVSDLTAAEALSIARSPTLVFMCRDGYAHTAPVGRFRANPFGLHDMLGNAWQFVQDCHRESYEGAPTDGSAVAGAPCNGRVARGGSFNNEPHLVRSGYRSAARVTWRTFNLGFRLARSL